MTDWSEKPGQRIFWARHVRHNGQDGPIDLPPGATHAFSPGPHHGHYSYTVAGLGEPPERKSTLYSNSPASPKPIADDYPAIRGPARDRIFGPDLNMTQGAYILGAGEPEAKPFPPHMAKVPPKISKPRIPSPEPMTKDKLLDRAKEAVAGRGLNYGKPELNFERIAARWRAHIMNRFGHDIAIDAASVAIMCADIKMARLENEPKHLDSWVDMAGYAACGAEITNG